MFAVVAMVLAGRSVSSGQAMILTGLTVIIVTAGLALHARQIFAGLPQDRASFENRGDWLSVSWPLFLMAGVQELLNQIDLILLGLLSNATQAAHFAASMRLASLVTFGLMAIGTVSGPLIASAYNRNDLGELARIARMSARFSTMFAVIIAALLVILGRPALGLFGPGFEAANPVLLVLLVGGLVNSLTGSVGYLLTMTGRERPALAIIVANLILIPRHGAVGAAFASALGLACWNLAMAIHMRRTIGIDATALGRARAGAD
jgi:O-antigen/teichoic acid export membrane protein